MLKKGILLSAVLCAIFCLAVNEAEARRGIVVPTAYGYGVINGPAPYIWPAYGFSGMHPAVPMPTAFGVTAPIWNGANWSYQTPWDTGYTYQNGYQPVNYAGRSLAAVTCNLNIRSEPYVAGRKKRNSNVVGSLNTGEQVHVLGRDGNWFFIQSAYLPLRRGYVYGSYLRFYQNNLPTSHYTAFYPTALNRGW